MRLLLLGLLFFISTFTHAQGLTDANIQSWAKAYDAVADWAKHNDLEGSFASDAKGNPDYSQLFTQALNETRTNKHYNDLINVLKKNGYSDPKQWASQGDRIINAFMSNQMEGNEAQVKQQLQQVKSMLGSGMVPPEQKAMMEEMLKESEKALTAAAKAPADDKAAVKRNQAILKAVFDNGE